MHTTPRYLLSVLCVAVLATLVATSMGVADGPSTSPEQEQPLIAILQSDAPSAEKAIACKKLAIYGSSDAVPELAKLLLDPQLSSWARTALEVIPGKASDDALLNATDLLQGRLLVGTINSIGVRRDGAAVAKLQTRLQDTDAEVASASAVALGRIGDDTAATALRTALKVVPEDVRSAVAEGCVLCAEQQLAQGNFDSAIEIYDEIRGADVPMQRIVEATRGAILARQENGIPLLLETIRSPEKKLRQLALATAREFPGNEVDKALAAELVEATPQRAAWIIQAMADRPQTLVLTAILQAAEKGDKQVRLSAIDALQRVGDDSCLSILLSVAADDDSDLSQAAIQTLASLPGANVDKQIVAMLPKAKGKDNLVLLQLVAQRRIDAVSEVVKALEDSDPEVRSAALVALGQTVSLERLALLISAVVSPQHPEDATVAGQALKSASIRMADREACARQLASALPSASAPTKVLLLEILSEVGGNSALETVYSAAVSSDDQMQDEGSRLLGKWNSVDAAPRLLDLATSKAAEKYRVRGLRGYIGVARKFPMPEPQRAAMCQKAMETSERLDEKRLVLDVLKLHPSGPGFKVASEAKQVGALKQEATETMLIIAQKLAGSGVDASALLADVELEPVKLEIVRAVYGAGETQRDVTDIIEKQAGNVAWVTLASPSYNASFGGDPVPGQVKQLKIQYRINGKAGEASFAENALIILPMPK